MNHLETFTNKEFGTVRTLEINNEPYFIGKDVAIILGYTNPRKAIIDHIDEEDKGVTKCDTPGGIQELTVINESGLYSLVFSSKLPTAKKFKHWVTSEVLPQIRKHGMYAIDEIIENPDLAIQALTALKEEREQKKKLEAKIRQDKSKVLFADAVETANTSILIGDLAKLIKQNGIDIGQKRLFEYLRQNKYLIKGGSSKNMPTQKSMELGLFEVKERTINNPDGSIKIVKTPKVTGKGQTYFINKFLSQKQVV